MPVDKPVLLRYKILNRCFRNRYKEYTIDDLVDECNKALRKADKQDELPAWKEPENSASPASGDGFVNIPDGVVEELPF